MYYNRPEEVDKLSQSISSKTTFFIANIVPFTQAQFKLNVITS